MGNGYTCPKCFGPSDTNTIMPFLDATCSGCKRNESLLRGQEQIARDAQRDAQVQNRLAMSDRDDLNGLKAVVKQLIKDMAAMEERFDEKLVRLSEYLGK